MNNPAWYESLKKSPLNPPPKVFGPVWGVLYAMIAVAFFVYWRSKPTMNGIVLFFIQLALNLAWTPLFFGAMQPCLALVDIAALVAVAAATVYEFQKRSTLAAALLLPYLAWVAFATYLNGYVCFANAG